MKEVKEEIKKEEEEKEQKEEEEEEEEEELRAERVLINGLDNRHLPYEFLSTADAREFSPNALIYYLR